MTAAGVAPSRPAAMRPFATSSSRAPPISTTAVSISAIAAYGSSRAGRPFPTLGVTKLTVLAFPRSVSGIPAPVGTPIALLTPGTTSQGTPAR